MNDFNQLIIINQNRQAMGASGNMGIGGANADAMEPLSINGMFSEFVRTIDEGGLIPLVAAMFYVKGLNQFRPHLESIGIRNALFVPSLVTNVFQKFPNIFQNRR